MRRWTVIEEAGTCTLTRTGIAPDWDMAAEVRLSGLSSPTPTVRRRIAHQVRQDLWRSLRRIRGFVPVVRVGEGSSGIVIRAGGRLLAGRPTARDIDRVAQVIENQTNQHRWMAFAAVNRA